MLKITGLKLPLEFGLQELRNAASRKCKIPESAFSKVTLVKKSVDARKKDQIHFVCAVEAEIQGDENKLVSRLKDTSVQRLTPFSYPLPQRKALPSRPVVIGFGPAGMFAALILAQCGQRPLVIERGQAVDKREKTVALFWKERVLSPECNVQFGEGGAGTFSDGKLTTGTGDFRIRKVLEEFVRAGAPEEILYDAKPHVGTDRLPGVVKAIREEIRRLGGEVWFETRVVDFQIQNGALQGLELQRSNGSREILPCTAAVLAIGHSARDTFRQIHAIGLPMEAKAFSVGVRIEHPTSLIDRAQYGSFAGNPALGAADYKLSAHLPNGRGVYTFCMCPGGYVTGAASEPGGVVTNGMSPWRRDGKNSNAAVLVGVTPADYGSAEPLAGVSFQRKIEQEAFRLGGGSYEAPAQRLEDFLAHRPTRSFGSVMPTYEPGVVSCEVDACFPEKVAEALRLGIPQLARRLSGFDLPDAVLTAPETRSSSPVRILRNEQLQSPLATGLYPCGEGAGYAGGIMSAAVDGIRCAEQILAPEKE